MKELIFRIDKIIQLCTNKSVLHLGFIQHSHLYEKKIEDNTWLHKRISEVASYLIGIDYLKEDVEKIREKYNYECYYADVTKLEEFDYSGKFDVIVCGELIEHLYNPGLFLDGIKRFMDLNTILIITTPNPWSKRRLKLLRKNQIEKKWLNPEHFCWFSFQTLTQLLESKGFIEVEYSYFYEDVFSKKLQKGQLAKKIKMIKHKMRARFSKEHYYTGLFFVTKLSPH